MKNGFSHVETKIRFSCFKKKVVGIKKLFTRTKFHVVDARKHKVDEGRCKVKEEKHKVDEGKCKVKGEKYKVVEKKQKVNVWK